ncbi:MAG: hypothetical protein U1D35_12180 [Paracoccaceae bacterium]|nr:hypothetical protein [Paracoccaceae bacterium]
MKKTLAAVATAALLSATALTATAQAPQEYDMVLGQVYRLLSELKLPTDNIGALSMGQVQQILAVGGSTEMGDGARARVQAILGQ